MNDNMTSPDWMVEAASFACPLTTAKVAIVADEDGDAMHMLVEAMRPGEKYIFADMTGKCRGLGIFPSLVGNSEAAMETKHYSAMDWMLGRYDNRLVGERRFRIEGKGHAKKFWVEELQQANMHGLHGFSPKEENCVLTRFDGEATTSEVFQVIARSLRVAQCVLPSGQS